MRGGADKVYLDTGELLAKHGEAVIYFSSVHPKNYPSAYDKYFVKYTEPYDSASFLNSILRTIDYLYSLDAKRKLSRLLKVEKPDVAHLHIFQSRLTFSILPVLKKYKIPVIMTLHEYKMLCPMYQMVDAGNNVCELCPSTGNPFHVLKKRCNKSSFKYSLISLVESLIRKTIYKYEHFVDRFLAVSSFVEDKHIQYKPELADKIYKLYNFVNLDAYTPGREKGDFFIYVGRLSREKGIKFLLEAWKNFPDVPLYLAGDGPMKSEILEYVSQHSLKNIVLLGFLSPNELMPHLQKAKFLILPSLTYETFGLTLIEAMACGTPPVAAKIGGMTELITHGENGLQFTSNSQEEFIQVINEALQLKEDQYQLMIENGFSFVNQNFGASQYYADLMAHYREIIPKKREKPKKSILR